MSENFCTINICDFEYEIADGGLPNVLCMVVYVLDEHLQHVDTIRMWRGDFGSAHALGREVILITQSEHDIPFDLRHLRYVRYLNNAEGRAALTEALQARMQTILGH